MPHMTPEQVQQMKQARSSWLDHERTKTRAIAALGLSDIMWAYEAGWTMLLGTALREVPPWLDQPAVLNARVKGTV